MSRRDLAIRRSPFGAAIAQLFRQQARSKKRAAFVGAPSLTLLKKEVDAESDDLAVAQT
jgi:hypothetical protein